MAIFRVCMYWVAVSVCRNIASMPDSRFMAFPCNGRSARRRLRLRWNLQLYPARPLTISCGSSLIQCEPNGAGVVMTCIKNGTGAGSAVLVGHHVFYQVKCVQQYILRGQSMRKRKAKSTSTPGSE